MRKFFNKFLLLICLGILLQSSNASYAQETTGVGAFVGGGSLGGNFPSQGSFTSSFFCDLSLPFMGGLTTRLSFIYVTDVNVLLPQTNNMYNPFVRGLSLKEMITKYLSDNIFFEGGAGPLILNDHSFSNFNVWDTGLAFSALAGIDFRNGKPQGISAGVGTEYGLTFTNTTVQYFSLHLQIKYSF